MSPIKNFIPASTINKGLVEIERAKSVAKDIMPNAEFVFVGMTNEHIVFNLVAKTDQITDQEIKDIKEKTRFACTNEEKNWCVYKGEFVVYVS